MNLVMTEETLPLGESLLLPPWPGCAGHVKRSCPALLTRCEEVVITQNWFYVAANRNGWLDIPSEMYAAAV